MPTAASNATEILSSMNAFPVTPFDEEMQFDANAYKRILDLVSEGDPGAIFTGCGTGEFWALTEDERVAAAATALEHSNGTRPIYVGWAHVGPTSIRRLNALVDDGVSGVLLMAPDPWPWDTDGVATYMQQMSEQVDVPVIAYVKSHRGISPSWWAETADVTGVAGLKDGMGDQDFLQGLIACGFPPSRIINGTPTAEWFSAMYWSLGVKGYSSAVMNFAPGLARRFRTVLEQDDQPARDYILRNFFWPLRQLRAESPSFAVTFVKAAVEMRGIPVGRARPPLGWPNRSALTRIEGLLRTGEEMVEYLADA